jgi:hypothetical protein
VLCELIRMTSVLLKERTGSGFCAETIEIRVMRSSRGVLASVSLLRFLLITGH